MFQIVSKKKNLFNLPKLGSQSEQNPTLEYFKKYILLHFCTL